MSAFAIAFALKTFGPYCMCIVRLYASFKCVHVFVLSAIMHALADQMFCFFSVECVFGGFCWHQVARLYATLTHPRTYPQHTQQSTAFVFLQGLGHRRVPKPQTLDASEVLLKKYHTLILEADG